MKKRHNESLQEWATRRASTKREKNLVALLAVRDDIEAGLDSGYAVRTIWLYLHEQGRVPCKYDAFLSFVNRHLRKDSAKSPSKTPPLPVRVSLPVSPKPGVRRSAPDEIRGFTFNPVPRKEDLI